MSNIAGQRSTDAVIAASDHRGGGESWRRECVVTISCCAAACFGSRTANLIIIWAKAALFRRGLNMLIADKVCGRCSPRILLRRNAKALVHTAPRPGADVSNITSDADEDNDRCHPAGTSTESPQGEPE
jgi:hypothetical protein